MVTESRIKKSFTNVRKDINLFKYNTGNNLSYLNVKVKEQGIRIRELERRLAQIERLSIRETIIR
ncbi:MAG: hypothetical protein KAK00_05675 [Nanoarchaeota archaeon]|nr:hypothetical protein [Thermodesulfovibrionia bacterium]MCK5282872.1 hypothetical protein [Nanoarchaeota archaeon]